MRGGRVIGRVCRGSDVGGLVRYLYGPGRANEHENPHLVAAWDAELPRDLALLEPPKMAGGGHDLRPLIAELEAALAYSERVEPEHVWHCPLRLAPGDRQLSDAEWGEVARDLLSRTGIAPRGDEGACRWVAVRHDDDSIHVLAVLARQDGARAHPVFDHLRVRETCLAAEQTYGLQPTAPADTTAARHTTRAEVERATRLGQPLPARDWLRREVQLAAAASREPAEFLDRLRGAGVEVRERRSPEGQLTGYAVGRAEPGRPTVLFGGGRLAADLSLPQLTARWAAAGPLPRDGAGSPVQEGALRAHLWSHTATAVAQAADAVRAHSPPDPQPMGDTAAAVAEVLHAAARLVDGPEGGPLTQAARDYDRAARETHRRLPAPTDSGRALRGAALHLARAGTRPGKREAAHVAVLVSQLTRLTLAVSRLREAQGRAAQATATRQAALALRDATARSERVRAGAMRQPAHRELVVRARADGPLRTGPGSQAQGARRR